MTSNPINTIEEITVEAEYCFGPEPLRLSNLAAVNFIFAPNGAGKTTISRALSRQPEDPSERIRWGVASTPLPIRVFNEDYKTNVLQETINGIFTIGEDSKQVMEQIQSCRDVIRDNEDRIFQQKDIIGLSGVSCGVGDTRVERY